MLFALMPSMLHASEQVVEEDLSAGATEIYKNQGNAVFQIRVINKASGEKSVLGSGFRVSQDNLYITNYHVVSEAVKSPEKFRVEYAHENGETRELSIKAIDVINDLAVLKGEGTSEIFLNISSRAPSKGDRIFSMGNPHDLGMMIIEGVYNGLKEKTFFEKILLSATLNGGMSGGPSFNETGEVIGVNVIRQADDIAGLVPARFITALLDQADTQSPDEKGSWNKVMEQQLIASQERIIGELVTQDWSSQKLGVLNMPKNISPAINCWGGGNAEDDENPRDSNWVFCQNADMIYLSSYFYTGRIKYHFSKFGSERLSKLGFERYYNEVFETPKVHNGSRREADATRYECKNNFLQLAERNWKATYCVRQYKNMPALYDTYMAAALISGEKEGARVEVDLQGVTKENALKFLGKFLNHVTQ